MLDEIFGMDDMDYDALRRRGLDYVRKYFLPVTPQALSRFTEGNADDTRK